MSQVVPQVLRNWGVIAFGRRYHHFIEGSKTSYGKHSIYITITSNVFQIRPSFARTEDRGAPEVSRKGGSRISITSINVEMEIHQWLEELVIAYAWQCDDLFSRSTLEQAHALVILHRKTAAANPTLLFLSIQIYILYISQFRIFT
jgi:hypothetical protein